MIPMSMYGSCYDIKGVKKNIQYILPILCQLYAFKWKLIFHTYICVKLHGALASKLLYFSHIHILQVVTRLRCFHILQFSSLLTAVHHLVFFVFSFFNFVQLCLAKGFICEYCKDGKDVIFPFMLNRVVQCLGALLSYNFLNRGLDC